MIVSFKCGDTRGLFQHGKTRLWPALKAVAERKLRRSCCRIFDPHRATGLKYLKVIVAASTAYVSMPSFEFASFGERTALRTLKLSITTEVQQ